MWRQLCAWFDNRGRDDPSDDRRARMISYLLERNSDLAGRDDCAMDLAKYDEKDAEEALLQVASDPSQEEVLLDTCGESLGEIWARQGRVDSALLALLQPPARRVALALIQAKRPELMPSAK
jgi:hypothetical protein